MLYFGIDWCHGEGKELFLTRVGFLERVPISNCSFIVRRAFCQLNVIKELFSIIKTYEMYFGAGTKGNKPKRGYCSRDRLV